jgi:hypothetical protein
MTAPRLRREALRKAAKDAKRNARQRGCTCRPDTVVIETDQRYPRHIVDLRHWPHCMLLRALEGPHEPQLITLMRADGTSIAIDPSGGER